MTDHAASLNLMKFFFLKRCQSVDKLESCKSLKYLFTTHEIHEFTEESLFFINQQFSVHE